MFAVDFDRAPFLVIWEVTRACALACRHCRAEAIDRRDPDELSLEEGCRLLDEVKAMGTSICILSGGDPLQRDDLEDLVRHGKRIGLRMGTIPAATPRLTRDRLRSLKAAGIDQVALSLDGSHAALHDGLRQVEGTFDLTMQAAAWAREEGIRLQVNTVFCAANQADIGAIADLVGRLGVVFWEIFPLIPTGRGAELQSCSAAQHDALFEMLYPLAKAAPYIIKIAEAPHYRRLVLEREGRASSLHAHQQSRVLSRPSGPGGAMGLSPLPVNAGKGFCFVDYHGDVFPSGFLPLRAGSVRAQPLQEIYRDAPLFRQLRDPMLLKGRCGRCHHRAVCGGSRSRAYAVHGDPLQEDPACAWDEPA